MEFDTVAEAVRGIPYMSPELGRRVYDHICAHRPRQLLELGTAYGVSAAYMAAALEANGEGHLTTLDHPGAEYDDPSPREMLARAGLSHRVSVVRAHSTYNWFLKERIDERADAAGNCEPLYDFCYLDGAHNWNVDGLAVVLIEKLLRPGGWLLMDDLDWTYADQPWRQPEENGRPFGPLSESERTQPHLRAVFDLIVRGHPSFTRFIVEDEWFGWAQKAPGAERRYELKTSRPLGAVLAAYLRRRKRQWTSRRTH